ncbi:DNA polymerase Y family protein [Aeoliella mucimassa]|uniref:DNA polymerase IV n=1 Tax=Aeoliella mucimassa TaxID=2527972 RepID=A0A518AT40_9BACT|nr:nucleotidyltransferase [Aeoliella mucimassa]QDU57893.1 DNA polymerase IV [Aeoliella mucimassa]
MIGHVDADCFYVSAERVRFPHLRGMPVGVLGNHGACIIAKSYEMKAAGVATGVPIWEAITLCPQAVYVKRDFVWYESVSRKMLSVVRKISPQVEFYSIDEQFFVAPDATIGSRLQRDILHQVGVPVSVGIAPTKTLAKLISDSSKPFGCGVVLTEDQRRELLHERPITDVTGIAKRSAKRLAQYGIHTCEQFAAADRAFIRWLLTKRGEDLWWELNGTPVQPVQTTRPTHKFVSRGGSIGKASRDPQRVQAFVVRNVERLVEALTHYELCCDQLILSLLFRDAPERSERCSLLGSRGDFETLLQAALHMLPRAWQPDTAFVHYMHVIASGLRPAGRRQRSLFEQSQLSDIKREINHRMGRFVLRSGATLPLVDVYGDAANNYDICDIYGKSCF